jgi:hypothetical protein
MSDPPAFGELYLTKYFGGFIYFISHTIKNQLKNAATLFTTSCVSTDERQDMEAEEKQQ